MYRRLYRGLMKGGNVSVIVKEMPSSDEWLFKSKAPGDQQTVENGLLFASEKRCR